MHIRLVRDRWFIEENALAEQKSTKYKEIKRLRAGQELAPDDFDEIGFNLLHWAVLCEQQEEARLLVEGQSEDKIESKVDVNSVTKFYEQKSHIGDRVDSCGLYNMTPLFIAAKQGSEDMVRLLLEMKADDSIKSRNAHKAHIEGPSPYQTTIQHKRHGVIKILVVRELDRAIEAKESEGEPTGCWSRFWQCCYPTKGQQLAAARALKGVLANERYTLLEVEAVAREHSSVRSGQFGKIYQAALTARKESGIRLGRV